MKVKIIWGVVSLFLCVLSGIVGADQPSYRANVFTGTLEYRF